MYIYAQDQKDYFLLYINNCLLFCESDNKLTKTIKTIQQLFNLTEQNIETNIYKYLEIELIYKGFKITMRQDGFIKSFSRSLDRLN